MLGIRIYLGQTKPFFGLIPINEPGPLGLEWDRRFTHFGEVKMP